MVEKIKKISKAGDRKENLSSLPKSKKKEIDPAIFESLYEKAMKKAGNL